MTPTPINVNAVNSSGISLSMVDLSFVKTEGNNKYIDHLSWMRTTTCYNQIQIMNYSCMMQVTRTNIEKVLKKTNIDNLKKIEILKTLYLREVKEHSKTVLKVYSKNIDHLKLYFKNREYIDPRACIKQFHVVDDEFYVGNDLRKTSKTYNDYLEDLALISSNKAFELLLEDSSKYYYLCNDIPTEIKERLYKNARINESNINNYKEKFVLKNKYLRNKLKPSPDTSWRLHWKDSNLIGNNEYEHFYKSTLVVPIRVLKPEDTGVCLNTVLPEATSKFTEGNIFGFLCIDHPMINYFNKEDDISVMYVIADFLSVYEYLNMRLNCDYQKAIKELSENET